MLGTAGNVKPPTVKLDGIVKDGTSGISSGKLIGNELGLIKLDNTGASGNTIVGVVKVSCGASCTTLSATLAEKPPGETPNSDLIVAIRAVGLVGPTADDDTAGRLILGAVKLINGGTACAAFVILFIALKALVTALLALPSELDI
ncbi:MAG: hypothetical protein GY718_09815 [Lentisphaerae bacterium]|nr:hypothetical protein [Lentisphaerota bacterium]